MNSCYELRREFDGSSNIVMLSIDTFNKISRNDILLKVLSCSDFKLIGISKSYYYYVLKKLQEFNLIRDNKINFKLLASYSYDYKNNSIKIEPKFILVGKKLLCVVNLKNGKYIDPGLLEELEIKDGRNVNLREKVINIISEILSEYLKRGVIYVA
ncbi:hypothetical protein [Sulfurisphaera ohwakuensis]|uniref:Uncharacterized protein n=1 Tax=Sulfurisphaera ohwakuensis TaxID=69656 RepID=A0A650CI37_SULOH|nr:hypothetical protein [Sulfurisphaera ohwakuensis]MBB5253526.1 hypothetical protein [Sulfurisphaera ohwakuensis]QGR17449.1 hypothetical protein D1869_09765 [Sulfurisphaera ohwakuensis]